MGKRLGYSTNCSKCMQFYAITRYGLSRSGTGGLCAPSLRAFGEHLDQDTAGINDRSALRLYREIAGENRRRRDARDFDWQGLAFSLDPATYASDRAIIDHQWATLNE